MIRPRAVRSIFQGFTIVVLSSGVGGIPSLVDAGRSACLPAASLPAASLPAADVVASPSATVEASAPEAATTLPIRQSDTAEIRTTGGPASPPIERAGCPLAHRADRDQVTAFHATSPAAEGPKTLIRAIGISEVELLGPAEQSAGTEDEIPSPARGRRSTPVDSTQGYGLMEAAGPSGSSYGIGTFSAAAGLDGAAGNETGSADRQEVRHDRL